MLSMWPPFLAIAEERIPIAEVLPEGDEVTDESTAFVEDGVSADSAMAAGNRLDADVAGDDDADILTSEAVPPEESSIERSARAFTESDVVFVRGLNNALFFARRVFR